MEPATTKTAKTVPLAFAIPKEEKLKPARPVRVRFAPAPTGFLHVGGARTALFNYLFAKKSGGKFILRLEDTDKIRSKPEFEQDIIESLGWLGIEWDEGPDIGGAYGPYRQSERTSLYRKRLEKLLAEDKAYWCFCTADDLKLQRADMLARGEPPRYSGRCAKLSPQEQAARRKAKEPAVIRFRMPPDPVRFHDAIRGKIEISGELIGDFIMARSLSNPLYNFAVVVDDALMEISHVIRGEDLLSSTPKQMAIAQALDFPKVSYAHLPLILAMDRSKFSKRHGTTSVREYREAGYLPEALVNFLALLGWNPGDDRERFTIQELTNAFSLERVQKAGAVFNLEKLRSMNAWYIRTLPLDVLLERSLSFFAQAKLVLEQRKDRFLLPLVSTEIDRSKFLRALELARERARTLAELPQLIRFLFMKKLEYRKEDLRWKEMEDYDLKQSLEQGIDAAEKLPPRTFDDPEALRRALTPLAESFGDRGRFLFPLRVALTGLRDSPGVFEVMSFLGKSRTVKRLQEALKKLSPLLVITILAGLLIAGLPARAQIQPDSGPLEVSPQLFQVLFQDLERLTQPFVGPFEGLQRAAYERLESLPTQEYILQLQGVTTRSFGGIEQFTGGIREIIRWLFTLSARLLEITSRALIQTGRMF